MLQWHKVNELILEMSPNMSCSILVSPIHISPPIDVYQHPTTYTASKHSKSTRANSLALPTSHKKMTCFKVLKIWTPNPPNQHCMYLVSLGGNSSFLPWSVNLQRFVLEVCHHKEKHACEMPFLYPTQSWLRWGIEGDTIHQLLRIQHRY